jgi:hypothetical protein
MRNLNDDEETIPAGKSAHVLCISEHVTVVLGGSHGIVPVAFSFDKIRRQATLIKICVIIFATSYCGQGEVVLENVDPLILRRKYRYPETSGMVHPIRDTPMTNAPLLKS